MKSILNECIERIQRSKARYRRYVAVLLVLSLCTTLGVDWGLHRNGIAATAEIECGVEAHSHSDECYTTTVTCGQEEAAASEGHSHSTDCYDENGNLTCGLGESEATEGHTHDDSCYTEELTCNKTEHTHTAECMSDTSAVETEDEWKATLPETLSGVWADDLVAVARSQLDYAESTENWKLDENDVKRGYTRYGAWYNADNPYGEWSAMFVAFCLNYAGIPETSVPTNSGCNAFMVNVQNANLFQSAGSYEPKTGDLVFMDEDGDAVADSMGIVESVDGKTLTVIEGDSNDRVEKNNYSTGEVLGYAALPENPDSDNTSDDAEITEDTSDESTYDSGLFDDEEESDANTKTDNTDSTDGGNNENDSDNVDESDSEQEEKNTDEKTGENTAEKIIKDATGADENTPSVITFNGELTDDRARVSAIEVESISTGTGPFDNDDEAGNDSSADNNIVRTFDSVTYNFKVDMVSYESGETYSKARAKLEFVLPLTEEQATFATGAMAWMIDPEIKEEEREIDGETKKCQVLTCYVDLYPSDGNQNVIPGTFGENVTINVKSMCNRDEFAPIFSACLVYGDWDNRCETHPDTQEKWSVTAEKVTVSAAPKYNIELIVQSKYKSTFDFSTGNDKAKNYGDGFISADENPRVVGRVTAFGVTIALHNDKSDKGYKGIELPDGNPITFDLNVSSEYYVNESKETKTISGDMGYLPRLWSCDGQTGTAYGGTNSDGRQLLDTHGCINGNIPMNTGNSKTSCKNGGNWTAEQIGGKISVTVSNYEVDVDSMPTCTGNGNLKYTSGSVGVFSSGEIWIVQPFNKIGGNGIRDDSYYDVVTDCGGEGAITLKCNDSNMKVTTIGGTQFDNTQTVTNDDSQSTGVAFHLPGRYANRVFYAKSMAERRKGVGVEYSHENGDDNAALGTELTIVGGMDYDTNGETGNALCYATNLTKFYGKAIDLENLEGSGADNGWSEGERKYFKVYYATKKDNEYSDWTNDKELMYAREDSLNFYEDLSDIKKDNKMCVGVLFCFSDPDRAKSQAAYYFGYIRAKIREDMSLTGHENVNEDAYILASTSKFWTKDMFENSEITVPTSGTDEEWAKWIEQNTPAWTESVDKRGYLPENNYKAGNTSEGSADSYKKTVYDSAGSIKSHHNNRYGYYGDTLLVIGYKAEISKTLVQKDSNVKKDKYNLDADQRVVDFKLQPSTTFGNYKPEAKLPTTVTIVDTLPKYLKYEEGSAYWGGTYTQTSDNGGTQGTITDGKALAPKVTNNKDGTQTLTWTLCVNAGDSIDPIYYSTRIGSQNPDEDVPSNKTENLLNKVRISATHDKREATVANGNYAEEGLAVVKGSASAYGKYSKQEFVEADGSIDYVVYTNNNSKSQDQECKFVDAMPVDGVNNSNFNGTWTISSFKLALKNSNTSLDSMGIKMYYTTADKYKGQTLDYLTESKIDLASSNDWTKASVDTTTGTVSTLTDTTPTMWYLSCDKLPAGSRIEAQYTIKLNPGEGATKENTIYYNKFSNGKTTTTTKTRIVTRSLEGLTWLDENADGIQDTNENKISGVKVTLLKLKDGGTATDERDYEPYHFNNDSEKPEVTIETGKQISVRSADASAATNYEQGQYKFTDLPAGTFAVRFEDSTTQKIAQYIASPDNEGTDDTKDSDGIPTYSTDKSTLQQTVILDIKMPTIENMTAASYTSANHDSGFYEKSRKLPLTGGIGTTPFAACGTALLGCAMLYAESLRRRRRKTHK